jgi:protease I
MATPRKVAILVEAGYQDLELWHPLLRLREEGIPVSVIGPEADKTYLSELEFPMVPDAGIAQVSGKDFGAVFVSGGASANRIAENERMVAFIKEAQAAGAVLASISNGSKAFSAAGAKPSVSVPNTDALPEFCKQLLKAL